MKPGARLISCAAATAFVLCGAGSAGAQSGVQSGGRALPVSILPGAILPAPTRAPESLTMRITALGQDFGGGAGISVRDVTTGWTTGYDSARLAPQQSVSKLWVALAVFDAFDRGSLRPDDNVTLTPSDLTLFHQPIRAEIGTQGYNTTIADLLERAMTQSDNTANDALLRRVGGPDAIRAMLERLRIANVRFGPGERLLQSRIAGLAWRQAFAAGNNFYAARAAVPVERRRAAIEAYAANPIDGAAPAAITLALTRLVQGDLLSPLSTTRLLALMERSKTGARRFKAGVDASWLLAHKTGTGQQLGATVAGFNDVGLLTAPDGHRYAIAVMIARTDRPIGARQQLIADVARAVIDQWRQGTAMLPNAQQRP
jgi:beta-lactamase class A